MPSVEDLAGSQQGSYTSVTSVATIVDEKCEDEGNVLSTHNVAEASVIEVGGQYTLDTGIFLHPLKPEHPSI